MYDSKLYKLYESKDLTFALIIINSILIPYYYLHRVGFLSNDYLRLIFEVIKSWLALFTLVMILIPKRIYKIIFGVSILLLLMMYGAYWVIYNYMVGLASAFSHG